MEMEITLENKREYFFSDAPITRVYFIQRMGGLGDVIMAFGAIHAMKEREPKALIFFMTEARYATLANYCPHINKVVTSPINWRHLMRQYTGQKYSVSIIDWSPMSFGINQDHQVNAYLESVGIYGPSQTKNPVVILPKKVQDGAYKKLDLIVRGVKEKRVILHPGQGDANRTWPIENWEKLVDIVFESGYVPIIVGDSSTIPYKGVMQLRSRSGLIDLTNRLTLEETLQLFNMAELFISADSGPIQLAGLSQIAIAGIYSTVPARCRLPFRNGLFSWRAVGVEPSCPNKGCYQLFLKDHKTFEKLQDVIQQEFERPGQQITNQFLGNYCSISGNKYACLKEEITPEKVWKASLPLLQSDWASVTACVHELINSPKNQTGQDMMTTLNQLPSDLNNMEITQWRAYAFALMGDWTNATALFREVMIHMPGCFALNGLGLILYANNNIQEAERFFNMAHQWNKSYLPAKANQLYLYSRECLEKNKPLEGLIAIEEYQAILNQMSESEKNDTFEKGEACLLRGYLILAIAKLGCASESFIEAATLLPESSEAAFGAGETFYWSGENEKARGWYEETLRRCPQHKAALERVREIEM